MLGRRPACAILASVAGEAKTATPLLCIHARANDVALYAGLTRYLPDTQPVLQVQALTAAEAGAYRSLEALAARQVEAIAAAQGDGPYVVLGECTGGALAYEVARQLRAGGRDVALLALIDAFPTGAPALAPHVPGACYRVLHRARILIFHLENLVRLPPAQKLAYVRLKGSRAGRALRGRFARTGAGAHADSEPEALYERALAAYRPQPYPGAVSLLRAERLPLGIAATQRAADLGWCELAQQLEVDTLPGYFTTLISEPRVRTLAQRLSEHLRRLA